MTSPRQHPHPSIHQNERDHDHHRDDEKDAFWGDERAMSLGSYIPIVGELGIFAGAMFFHFGEAIWMFVAGAAFAFCLSMIAIRWLDWMRFKSAAAINKQAGPAIKGA